MMAVPAPNSAPVVSQADGRRPTPRERPAHPQEHTHIIASPTSISEWGKVAPVRREAPAMASGILAPIQTWAEWAGNRLLRVSIRLRLPHRRRGAERGE